ncbi:MAG: translation initiation factor IF-1 [Acidobacteria bacterium]|nr:translation initiation factor IF-1 [Acidobacteriota bacterium]
MGSDETIEGRPAGGERVVPGTVVEELPRAVYRVELDTRRQVLAHPVGLAKRNFVRLLPGDRVEVALAPRDWTRGRITRRLTGIEGK